MSHEKCPNCGKQKHQLNRCKCGFQRNKNIISNKVIKANEEKRKRRRAARAAKKAAILNQLDNAKVREDLKNLRKRIAQFGFHEGASVPGSQIRKIGK